MLDIEYLISANVMFGHRASEFSASHRETILFLNWLPFCVENDDLSKF